MARFQVWILLLLFVGYFAHSSSSDHINFIYDRIYVGGIAFFFFFFFLDLPPYSRDCLLPMIADQTAAGNLQMLQQEYNITGTCGSTICSPNVFHPLSAFHSTAVLNVAWDLDIRYPVDDYVGSIADDNEHLYMQYNKV